MCSVSIRRRSFVHPLQMHCSCTSVQASNAPETPDDGALSSHPATNPYVCSPIPPQHPLLLLLLLFHLLISYPPPPRLLSPYSSSSSSLILLSLAPPLL